MELMEGVYEEEMYEEGYEDGYAQDSYEDSYEDGYEENQPYAGEPYEETEEIVFEEVEE